MGEADERERLKRLDERIARLKASQDRPAGTGEHYSQAQVAWRMVTELVAGLGLGFAIGIGLDAVFGTKPFLMILFLFFGLAAGIKVMLRTAAELGQPRPGAAGKDDAAGTPARKNKEG